MRLHPDVNRLTNRHYRRFSAATSDIHRHKNLHTKATHIIAAHNPTRTTNCPCIHHFERQDPRKQNQDTMDSVSNSLAGVDLTKLSDRDKQELQQFVLNESQKARIQACMWPLSHPLIPNSHI